MHWSEEIAQRIIDRNPNKEEYVCAAGISPSGSIHIGNFRDIATSYFVVRALRKMGKKAKLLFSWDEFDRLRKVPVNVAKVRDDFEQHIGKPYADVENPFADAPGSAIVCSVEGTRPILAEIQALVSKSGFSMPKRMATGVDYNRVSLIMTVLEKRMGLHLGDHDAYVNVTGGIKLDEAATDLAIACAIASSFRDKPLPQDMAFFGEIGLTGEIRTVTQASRRISEIQKMGFKRCMLPFDCLGSIDKCDGIELIAVKTLSDVLAYI